MFKKSVALLAAVTLFGSTVFAAGYNGKCMNQKGKQTECVVDVSNGTVSVRYKRKGYSELDRRFSGDAISAIVMGDYSKRRIGAAVVGSVISVGFFPPLALLALTKKKRDQVGIEFVNEQGKTEAVTVSLKKKEGQKLARNLRAVSGGLKVTFTESPKKKISKKEQKRQVAINADITDTELLLVGASPVQIQ